MTNMPKQETGPKSPSRRNFISGVGATVASLNAAACIRKPYERILPYNNRPEDLVPGVPRSYATAYSYGETVQGLLATSTDGRPTKIEGNPSHPLSGGATSPWAQASVLELYDPERIKTSMRGQERLTRQDVEGLLDDAASSIAGGAKVALVLPRTPSPTVDRILAKLARSNVSLFFSDPLFDSHAFEGAKMVGLGYVNWTYGAPAEVVATFDADPMSTDGDSSVFSRNYAKGRAISYDHGKVKESKSAFRMYSVEPFLSLTGANADHRKAVKTSEVTEVLAALAWHLRSLGVSRLPGIAVQEGFKSDPWVKALAEDLVGRARGTSLVLVGERQPAQAHALGLLINQALGNFGSTLVFTRRQRPNGQAMAEFVQQAASFEKVFILGTNPVYDAPGNLKVGEALSKAKEVVHLGLRRDATGAQASVCIGQSHDLEAWGDRVGRDGTVSIQQPLIAPLFETMSTIEVLGRLAKVLGENGIATGYELVRGTHKTGDGFEKSWQQWLHDGVVSKAPAASPVANAAIVANQWTPGPVEDGYEVVFHRDRTVLDGRFANSPWLQELPDPITKMTWDNPALMSAKTAKKLGVSSGKMIEIAHHGEKLKVPVWVQPGTADDVVALSIGYGQSSGQYARNGFDVNRLRVAGAPWALTGVEVSKARGSYALACTQVETDIHDRPLHREATRADFADDPDFVEKFEVMPKDARRTFLWADPYNSDNETYKWGMTVDLNACSGCSACVVACQAENNIPWVGKNEVLKGREMHWIRLDRYFEDAADASEVKTKLQSTACVHCETAPCENVCPVAATVHSPEGTNDMVYNRCIGTRYCSNNCPYKVRRFNFFHYTVRNDEEYGMGIAMQRNPNVTVRYRGVMEKCSFCMQRISAARIQSRIEDRDIKDGEIVTACQQACPTDAIRFGNLNDKESRVSKAASEPRNYAVLAELNLRPRTTYLARLTNPNPKLKNG